MKKCYSCYREKGTSVDLAKMSESQVIDDINMLMTYALWPACDSWHSPHSALCASTKACQSSNWQSARLLLCLASQLTSFSVALVFLPFFPCAWGGPCLGQGTATDVRNILCLYIIKKVLEHVKQLRLHSDGLHLQRWEASTTSLKV